MRYWFLRVFAAKSRWLDTTPLLHITESTSMYISMLLPVNDIVIFEIIVLGYF